ncbi:MAG TPA: hypothetical protein VF329_10510 [Gammaproteobacteria bacterium]
MRAENQERAGRRTRWWIKPRALVVQCSSAAQLAASGCTTMQTVEPPSGSAAWQEVDPGETVLVSLRDGSEVDLSFVSWTSEGLTGTDEVGALQEIEPDEIARIEVERTSIAKSIGLGAAVGAVLVGIAVDTASDITDGLEDVVDPDR